MNGEYWRKHVEAKGWTNGNRIAPPEGKEVEFHLEGGGSIKATPKNVVTFDDYALNCVDDNAVLWIDKSVRWLDVVSVSCGHYVDMSEFFEQAKATNGGD